MTSFQSENSVVLLIFSRPVTGWASTFRLQQFQLEKQFFQVEDSDTELAVVLKLATDASHEI